MEIEVVSQHWLKLTINWISPVIGSRPDVCFIWRNIPSKGQEVTPEEIAILKEHYPKCKKHTDLLQLFPERTLKAIYRMVSKYGLQKSGPLMKADALSNLTWTDLQAFPDRAKSLELAKIATEYCRNEKRQMAALWVMSADLSTRDMAPLYTLTEEPSSDILIDDSVGQPGR